MAKSSGLGQNFYVTGRDISGDVSAIDNAGSPRQIFVTTGIDKAATERLLGRSDGNLSWTTFFNDAANQQHAILGSHPTTDITIIWALGTSLGSVAAGLVAKQVFHNGTEAADGSLTFSTEAQGAGSPLEWGNMVTAGKVTHSSAGTSTGDVTAQTTVGGIGYLQIFSLGSGTPTVLIEHSSDTSNGIDGSWSTLLTFATQAQGGERKVVTGTVRKGLRLKTTGSFSNCVIAICFRRATAQDDVDLS